MNDLDRLLQKCAEKHRAKPWEFMVAVLIGLSPGFLIVGIVIYEIMF